MDWIVKHVCEVCRVIKSHITANALLTEAAVTLTFANKAFNMEILVLNSQNFSFAWFSTGIAENCSTGWLLQLAMHSLWLWNCRRKQKAEHFKGHRSIFCKIYKQWQLTPRTNQLKQSKILTAGIGQYRRKDLPKGVEPSQPCYFITLKAFDWTHFKHKSELLLEENPRNQVLRASAWISKTALSYFLFKKSKNIDKSYRFFSKYL